MPEPTRRGVTNADAGRSQMGSTRLDVVLEALRQAKHPSARRAVSEEFISPASAPIVERVRSILEAHRFVSLGKESHEHTEVHEHGVR